MTRFVSGRDGHGKKKIERQGSKEFGSEPPEAGEG
jgi:hypothetical protein